MIYIISEKEEPINSCVLELELAFNSNSNSDNNDDKNNNSSFHLAKTYTAFTIYYFDQAYLKDNYPLQQNILIALQGIQTALRQRNNILLLLFRNDAQDLIKWLDDFEKAATTNQYNNKYKFQIIGHYLQGSPVTWFLQETNANAQQKIIRWAPANAREDNISFTTWFETKFKTPILISKWHMGLEKRTQGPVKVIDSERNWTEEQKIHFFTKGLRTDLSYALWLLLALKDNPTMDMAIELA
ncbi:hypothetical protein G9A89_016910 [Geosiphon pyriformis]|nr:hypothetical protein G9A89_016910 [Geosiphon pyriformis]